MKPTTAQLASLLKTDREQPVRLIKAAQASKLLGNGHAQPAAGAGPAAPHAKAEIRLVKSGPDYCDLEIVCGCGEVTPFRCWNSPGAA
ncbi:MAG: hypothetical protein WDO13_05855 [Verrucomicrobiota bacterium]